MVVVPVKLLVPDRIRSPEPFLVKLPEPVRDELEPRTISPLEASSVALPLIFIFIKPLALLDAPVIVRLEPETLVRVAFPLIKRVRFDVFVKFPPPTWISPTSNRPPVSS